MTNFNKMNVAGANLDTKNLSQQTPLHMAVETGQMEVVALLLEAGCKINSVNSYGQTPIAIAQTLRKTKIMELLKKTRGHVVPM